ncbi:UNVERIFIED_CONTAM: hypothetical protein RMT77_018869 [Armadillidium vulgare]
MNKYTVLRNIKGSYSTLSHNFRTFTTFFEGSFYGNKRNETSSLGKIPNSQLQCKYQHCRNSFCTSVSCASQKSLKIGCASGFWGDSPSASLQLIKYGNLDFIIYDYLSEITMSLLTAAKAKRPDLGYTPDFVSHAVGPYLAEIKQKGIKIISNAGGINPEGCAEALQNVSKKSGVDLKIAVVSGDNLISCKDDFIGVPDMNDKKPLPATVHSMNCYLGSEPIVKCLDLGADVVITGRCADSSLALAPLIHSFGWKYTDFDLLASGSLAGHLIECGAQVTGGIFTDWDMVDGWDNIGFPIAEVYDNGDIYLTKPPKTGGLISRGTICEQLLYEIGDPRAYILPDVVCDFTKVKLDEVERGIKISGCIGKAPTNSFKVCSTYLDGYKTTAVCCVGGRRSVDKARKVAYATLKRCRKIFQVMGLKDFTRTHVQVLGSEDTYGSNASTPKEGPREAVLWMSVQHSQKKALEILAMEVASAGTGMAPGLTAIVGGRPKPAPLLRLHSFLVKKEAIKPVVKIQNTVTTIEFDTSFCVSQETYKKADEKLTIAKDLKRGSKSYPLSALAFARSGDKGDSCNIGVIARKESFLPYIQEALTVESLAAYFKHLFPEDIDPKTAIKRYNVHGIHALNFVMEGCLGGGGIASLRSDPQGKALAQMLLDFEIKNMPSIDSL